MLVYLKKLIQLTVLLAITLFIITETFAVQTRKIAIVKSKNLVQFQDAISGFKKALQEEQIFVKTEEYDLVDGGQRVVESIKLFSPDLIVPIGSVATKFAQENFRDIPIVFAMVLYPLSMNSNIRNITENITGASMDIPILKQFETIKDVLPGAKKIGVLYDPNQTGQIIAEAQQVAQLLGMELVGIKVNSNAEVLGAIKGLERKIDILWTVVDSTIFSGKVTEFIITYSLQNNIPVMGFSTSFVESGALFCLTQDFVDIGRQTAEITKLVLSGTKPKEIKIAAARKVSLILNLRIAKEIGVNISEKVINKSAKVIR
ncbi:MAG: ABC transporter substrate-binding protein [Blastocatellia bacterium]